ncbi:MAG: rhomboid family intramembrane serine protease [Micropepsaceae bacterium]
MTPVTLAFLMINGAVFAAWLWLGQSPFMTENFLISADAVSAGRSWTLLTSAFSHILFIHFFLNMYVLATFGPIVEHTIGSARFFGFYLVAAILSSLAHAAVSTFLMDKPALPALGASGAISGVILLFSFLYSEARILLFGFIPMPALIGAAAFVGIDLAGLAWQSSGGGLPIGHGAHLGGALTGTLYYLLVIRPLVVQRSRAPTDFGDVATWRRRIEEQHLLEIRRRER